MGPLPLWSSGRRPPPALPTTLVGGIPLVALVWFLVFGLRRGPFWPVLVAASAVMLAVSLRRVPRHQDLLMVHQGLIVLGLLSALALVFVFLILSPVARNVSALAVGYRRVDASVRTAPVPVVLLLLLLVTGAEEMYWR